MPLRADRRGSGRAGRRRRLPHRGALCRDRERARRLIFFHLRPSPSRAGGPAQASDRDRRRKMRTLMFRSACEPARAVERIRPVSDGEHRATTHVQMLSFRLCRCRSRCCRTWITAIMSCKSRLLPHPRRTCQPELAPAWPPRCRPPIFIMLRRCRCCRKRRLLDVAFSPRSGRVSKHQLSQRWTLSARAVEVAPH